ncbi:MAG: peptidylprolyl isomerase [Bernardetiaceae bacterium]|nr:peptidylprolyl isomerase [Bernardetiaceae bacterium]
MRSILFCILVVCWAVFGCKKPTTWQSANRLAADDTLWLITQWQDRRATDSLIALCWHTKAAYKEAIAYALASVQDTLALPLLYQLLNDTEPQVRKAAAYAIGQIGSTNATAPLVYTAQKDNHAEVVAAALEAIGKCADSAALQMLATLRYDALQQAPQRFGQITGLYRALTWKSLRLPVGDKKALTYLHADYPDSLRIMAANYFARNPDKRYEAIYNELFNALGDAHPHVRLNIALAVANASSNPIQQKLQQLISSDSSVEVQVAALRALASLQNPTPIASCKQLVAQMLSSKQPNLAVAAAEVVRTKADKVSIKYFYSILDSVHNPRARAIVMATLMKFHPSGGQSFVVQLLNQSTDPYEQGYLLKALAEDSKNAVLIANYLWQVTQPPFVRTSAMEALLQIHRRADFFQLPEKAFIQQQIAKALQSQDAALIALAAQAIAEPANKYAEYFKKDTTQLHQAKQTLQIPRDIETLAEIEKAIAHIAGRQAPHLPEKPAWNHPIDRQLLSTIRQGQEVLVQTTQGNITLQLLPEHAPGSVTSFVKLVQAGYYNGKTFHRVVPNFVVQGGCPRGDGYGGMGYTLRSEFAPLRYTTGTVGLASAGKDTESCQWFITHIPTPHLDGRYTIFARVRSGMEVVNKLQPGDKILTITLC